MKKFLLAGLFIGSMGAVNAQSFHMHTDTARAAVSGVAEIHNDIMNMSGSPITVSWKVLSHTLPPSWVAVTGICDNFQCYQSTVFDGTSTKVTQPIASGATATFDIQMDASSLAPGGPYYAVVELKEGSTTVPAVFELTKFTTGVATVSKTSDVVVYPNPARSELNILFDGNAVKTIAVYNLIGKAVKVYKVSGNSAKLDIDNLPSGIHFVNLYDGQGRVVATRKFTHL